MRRRENFRLSRQRVDIQAEKIELEGARGWANGFWERELEQATDLQGQTLGYKTQYLPRIAHPYIVPEKNRISLYTSYTEKSRTYIVSLMSVL
jgi:hypothetical protein